MLTRITPNLLRTHFGQESRTSTWVTYFSVHAKMIHGYHRDWTISAVYKGIVPWTIHVQIDLWCSRVLTYSYPHALVVFLWHFYTLHRDHWTWSLGTMMARNLQSDVKCRRPVVIILIVTFHTFCVENQPIIHCKKCLIVLYLTIILYDL